MGASIERESLAERRGYLTLRAAEWIGMHVPRGPGLWGANVYHKLYYGRAGEARETVAENLAHVLGHPSESELVQRATEECFRLYGRYWYETFALRVMPRKEVLRRFSIEGREHLDSAVAGGKGAVLTLPHMGNWDAAGHWLALEGYKMVAVAEELKPRAAFELFLRHRRALGMGIVPLTGAAGVGERLVRLLSENHLVTLVADRDLTGRGVEVEMFGAARRLPAGPAFLALATGAPLHVCAVFTTGEGWHCIIGPRVEIERTREMRRDVTSITALIAAGFERYIASAPTDWHMFQPAWGMVSPPGERGT